MKNNLISRSGMNLAEVLIALSLIGTLAALTMPVLQTTMPDEYDASYKKAVYALEHSVADIVNNEDYYDVVETTNAATGETIKNRGLKNVYAVTVNGQTYGDSNNANSNAAKQKFCRLIASKFNVRSAINCTANRTFDAPTFETQDGVKWILPISNFSTANEKHLITFYVAADGKSKCGYLPEGVKTKFFTGLNDGGNSTLKTKLAATNKNDYGIVTTQSDCKRPAVFVYAITPMGQLISPEALSDKVKTK